MHSRHSETIALVYGLRRTIAGLAALGILLAVPAARAGLLPLPANGSQVNDDLTDAIDPNLDWRLRRRRRRGHSRRGPGPVADVRAEGGPQRAASLRSCVQKRRLGSRDAAHA